VNITSYENLSDLELLSLCVWREARGEGMLGKRGVAHVVANRAEQPSWWGNSVKSVILHPFQFSSFNEDDSNSSKWPEDNDPSYSDCLTVSEDVLDNGDEDITNGATSYYSIDIPPPFWVVNMTLTLAAGHFRFYKENV
jgi:N-acetylmuramoyl-L-alanine amidase